MTTFLQDLRFAVRMLLKRPGLTGAAVLSLALGIGANATVYTWIQGVLLRPLPGVTEQDRIVFFENRNEAGNSIGVCYPDFLDYQRGAKGIALIGQDDVAMSLTTKDRAERVYGALVSGNYFDVLGVRLALGRGFRPDEDLVPDAHPVVVLSHALWQRRLDADPRIVGRAITLNGHAFTVIGVTPPEFIGSYGGVGTELWVPMMMQAKVGGANSLDQRGNHWMNLLGRLGAGVGRETAQAELNVIARQLSRAYPTTNAGMTVRLYPMWQAPGGAGKVLGPGAPGARRRRRDRPPHRVRQRRQPAARPRHRSPARDGHPPVARRIARTPAPAAAHRGPAARRRRRTGRRPRRALERGAADVVPAADGHAAAPPARRGRPRALLHGGRDDADGRASSRWRRRCRGAGRTWPRP